MTELQPSDFEALLSELPPAEANRLRDVWHLVGPDEPVTPPLDTEAALRLFESTLDMRETVSSNSRRQLSNRQAQAPHRTYRWQRITITLVVLLLLGALGSFWWTQPVTKTAALGERLTVTLPDGSTAELNSGSSLRYERRFGKIRLVDLQGEAFFDVIRETRPFIVRTFNAQVEVLGTRFNVRAWSYSYEQGSTIALESGSVTVAPRSNLKKTIILEPGQTHRIVSEMPATAAPISLSVEEATAWRRGDFVFKNQPVDTILDEVERRFAVDITLQSFSVRATRLSLALRQPASAEAIVRDLAAPLGLAYRETANGFELYTP